MRGFKMNRRLGYYEGIAGGVLAVLVMVFMPASAQQGKAPLPIAGGVDQIHEEPAGGPAPRAADGHPDLSGLWYPSSAGRQLQRAYPVDPAARRQYDPKVTPEEKPSFKPGMEEKYKRTIPYGECAQAGTPTSLLQEASLTWPMELIQTPGKLAILIEYPMDIRMIHTDGRAHPKDPDPTFNGDSTARWVGDTLVIDVTAIEEKMWNLGGWFHSDQEQVTIEDPVVLAKPWQSAPRRWSLAIDPNDELEEFFCTHNEEPRERETQHLQ
jgi:hypothetical protein